MGRGIAAILSVPAAAAAGAVVGFVAHGSDAFGRVAPIYLLVGAVVGIGVSLIIGKASLPEGRERNDYISEMASRDASAYAFRDLLLVILVASFVFVIAKPVGGLAAFSSSMAAVGLIDWTLRRRKLDRSYSE